MLPTHPPGHTTFYSRVGLLDFDMCSIGELTARLNAHGIFVNDEGVAKPNFTQNMISDVCSFFSHF